ncbi:MAG: histidine phosphatase family protein [bacterium]|nr:histidine phosphatase family protein [bacterium]
MTFYFVRHGQSRGNKAGVISGQDDHPLTEEGLKEAQQTAVIIPVGISLIYSSDLSRCQQTAEVLNKGRQLPIIYDARLRERSFGSLSGKTWDQVDLDGVLHKKDQAQEYDYQSYGGESVQQVTDRLHACIEDIKKTYPNEKVLVVTSAGIIRLLHYLYGEKEHHIPNASLHEFIL